MSTTRAGRWIYRQPHVRKGEEEGGLLRVDKKKIDAEVNLDGKYLLRTSHPNMSVENIALGCKQLLAVERAWRDMKSTLDLRPV